MSQPESQPDTGMGDSNDANAQTQASSAKRKRKPIKERSEVWDHFTKFTDAEGFAKARCKYCEKVYHSDTSANGTSSLSKHLKVCKKLPLSGESRQTQLSLQTVGENESTLKKWHFDLKVSRRKLAAMIIIDELPFRFVEGEGFKDFMHYTQPLFKMPSRFTVARDCYQIFLDEKKKLTTYFRTSGQRVNITTDTWTSIQKINYMCITAHYIDHNFILHKKIINFCPIEGHKGELLARDLDMYLKEWGISKVYAITVDNASSNYTCIQLLKESELDIYLKESVYVTKNDEFDILKWWKVNSSRFPILSQLARDVLAIPISTVASESAFSTGGRVLDPYRSSLSPKVVEGLLCAQDWLRSYKRPKTIEEDFNDIEKFEEAFSALNLNKDSENAAEDLDIDN